MECPLCGYAFAPQEAAAHGCQLCPLHDGCGAISCPNCGYCQPSTAKIEGRLRRLARWLRGESPAHENTPQVQGWTRLRDLAVGTRARVVAIRGFSSRSAARLGGFCILPGAVIELLQRKPAFVVRVEETTVALESKLAGGIWVQSFLPGEEALPAASKR
ncbi:MAG: hypothetical protein A3J27_15370 [Candidatus Tectomicrobia bacterium RIFCSPLOWO2_12_FULL_69_37]|nr:MAG: hypothetical protein A3I72_07610 [Candidatus Tectomicrobia bacterium RIFCSPLOWO2_02_FULL_70_19]OGL63785.1 MAG: hypothetical protein A3J27_15370 [Candidatus Tectomicrobia bacterium RIFCSPLOWO2_12_FULL_69_37]